MAIELLIQWQPMASETDIAEQVVAPIQAEVGTPIRPAPGWAVRAGELRAVIRIGVIPADAQYGGSVKLVVDGVPIWWGQYRRLQRRPGRASTYALLIAQGSWVEEAGTRTLAPTLITGTLADKFALSVATNIDVPSDIAVGPARVTIPAGQSNSAILARLAAYDGGLVYEDQLKAGLKLNTLAERATRRIADIILLREDSQKVGVQELNQGALVAELGAGYEAGTGPGEVTNEPIPPTPSQASFTLSRDDTDFVTEVSLDLGPGIDRNEIATNPSALEQAVVVQRPLGPDHLGFHGVGLHAAYTVSSGSIVLSSSGGAVPVYSFAIQGPGQNHTLIECWATTTYTAEVISNVEVRATAITRIYARGSILAGPAPAGAASTPVDRLKFNVDYALATTQTAPAGGGGQVVVSGAGRRRGVRDTWASWATAVEAEAWANATAARLGQNRRAAHVRVEPTSRGLLGQLKLGARVLVELSENEFLPSYLDHLAFQVHTAGRIRTTLGITAQSIWNGVQDIAETWTLLAQSPAGFTGTDLATAITLTEPGVRASDHDELAWLVEDSGNGVFLLNRAPYALLQDTYGGHSRPSMYTRMAGNNHSEFKLLSDTEFGIQTSGTQVWAVWGITQNGGFVGPGEPVIQVPIDPPTPQLPTDATLSGLVLSSVNFGVFSPGTLAYTANVASGVEQTTVTPQTAHAEATYVIKLGGVTDPDGTVALAVGSNIITVEVTAEDGTTVNTYTVVVTRAQPPTPQPYENIALSPPDVFFANHTLQWAAAFNLGSALSDLGSDLYLRIVRIRGGTASVAGRVQLRLARSTTENPAEVGPDFSTQMETSGSLTFVHPTVGSLTVAGPSAASNLSTDTSDPYSWRPSNKAEIVAFADAVGALPSADRGMTLTFDPGV